MASAGKRAQHITKHLRFATAFGTFAFANAPANVVNAQTIGEIQITRSVGKEVNEDAIV